MRGFEHVATHGNKKCGLCLYLIHTFGPIACIKSDLRWYKYVCMEVCHNSSACHVYVMWAELGHSHLYVPSVSNVVTNGNGTGTKNVLKGAMRFGLTLVSSLLSSRRCYCSESNTILYLDTVYCKSLLLVRVKMNLFKHRYYSTQTNLVYLGLVYVTMNTGTRS